MSSRKKNVALCVFGVHPRETEFNSSSDSPDNYVLQGLNVNVINVNKDCNFYIFLHSWSTKHKKWLVNTYHPTECIIENQKVFNMQNYHSRELYNKIKTPYNMKTGEVFYSHLYSTFTAVQLKKQYEKSHKIRFDFVLLFRLDLVWLRPLNFSKLDSKKLYHLDFSSQRSNLVGTLIDYVFISNSKNIDIIANLYKEVSKYDSFEMHAEYTKHQHIQKNKLLPLIEKIPNNTARLYRRCKFFTKTFKKQQELPERYRKVINNRRIAASYVKENAEWKVALKRLKSNTK